MDQGLKQRLARVIYLQHEIDLRKELYKELDALAVQMRTDGFSFAELEGLTVELVDNFEIKNTVFRPAGVKRYEFEIKKVK